jgi:ABC-type transport system involved in multi-copper enzyme maturation permease subunit
MRRVVASELLKLRTTKAWWLLLIGTVVMTAFALFVNLVEAHFQLARPTVVEPPPGFPPEETESLRNSQLEAYNQAHSALGLAKLAAGVYTSGQTLGPLFVLLLGVIIVTSEFFHQTATATFLATPHRSVVAAGKLVTAILVGAVFWLVATVINIVAGVIFFGTEGVSNSLGRWDVTRSVLLNLAAFAVWAVFGIGLGVLIRSQIGAVVTGSVLYLVSVPVLAQIPFLIIQSTLIKKDWVLTAQVIAPSVAAAIMTTPGRLYEHAAPQWAGAVVLIGYAVLTGAIGTVIMRRRDIS